MRSATAHKLYDADSRFEIKSAGIDANASVVLTKELLDWADAVVVMEKLHRNTIRKNFPNIYLQKQIVGLYIPDDFEFMQPELIELLKNKFEDVYKRGLLK